MRKKLKAMQATLQEKGLGAVVESALAAAGLSNFCRSRDVFERLYQDALRRMQVYAENQMRLLQESCISFKQTLHHLASHPLAAVNAAVEMNTSRLSPLQVLQDRPEHAESAPRRVRTGMSGHVGLRHVMIMIALDSAAQGTSMSMKYLLLKKCGTFPLSKFHSIKACSCKIHSQALPNN